MDAREIARANVFEGISVERSANAHLSPDRPKKTGQRGRPTKNILANGIRNDARMAPITDLVMKRVILLTKHKLWKAKHGTTSEGADLMPSIKRRAWGQPIWTVYWVAELAWILMGHRIPPQPYPSRGRFKNREGFFQEVFALWFFVNIVVEESVGHRKGPKRNAEKLFKTALAAFVARNLIQPRGGNWTKLPSPREISQVWYILFGEKEPYDHIKNRLESLGRILTVFPLHYPSSAGRQFTYFPKLGRALKYHAKRRASKAGGAGCRA